MVLYAVPGDIGALIDLFNFVIWIIYAMVTLEVIILRWTKPDVERPYKVKTDAKVQEPAAMQG